MDVGKQYYFDSTRKSRGIFLAVTDESILFQSVVPGPYHTRRLDGMGIDVIGFSKEFDHQFVEVPELYSDTDLIVGECYYFDADRTAFGVYIGEDRDGVYFTPDHRGKYTAWYSGTFKCDVVGFLKTSTSTYPIKS